MRFDCCEQKYECEKPIEQVCDKYIYHEVPHYVPIYIKHVNHHIFKHKYIPVYQEYECNVCEDECFKKM